MPAVQYETVLLAGGLDQTTSSYQLAPGALRECLNFACKPNGGYYRVPGYERFDGRQSPSSPSLTITAVFWLDGVGPALGTVVELRATDGITVLFTGTLCYKTITGDSVTAAAFTKSTGAIVYSGAPFLWVAGVEAGIPAQNYATDLTFKEIALMKAAAAGPHRDDIQVVPGSGPIRGVVYHNDIAYAFRDNVGGTACAIYKSSASGWVNVPLGWTVAFSATATQPVEGGTLTQGGVTATIKRVVVTSGTFLAGTAVGYLVLSTLAGGTFASGASTVTAGTLPLSGTSAAITLQPGGRYNFDIGNFTGASATRRIYGADGVNAHFEFDGTVYVPLNYGGTVKAKHVEVHNEHLFISVGSSLVNSAIGNPYNYEVILGAGETATGSDVTGMVVMPGTQDTAALMVFGRNATGVIYGTSTADFKRVNYDAGVGALENTMQSLFDVFALDDRGVTATRRSINYGNFDAGTLTNNIQRLINENRNKAVCSGLSRENSQYRVFFNNGFGLYVTVNSESQLIGHGVVLFPDIPTCMFDGEASTGETVELFGTDSGFVMRNDIGTSFDGANINALINLNVNAVKTPRLRKRFRKTILEVQATSYVDIQVGYTFEWGSVDILPHGFNDAGAGFGTLSFWDEFTWEQFFWDGRYSDALTIDMNGTGENVQLLVTTTGDYMPEFTLSSAILHYNPRRGNR